MSLRQAFLYLKLVQQELQELKLPKGKRDGQMLVETIMEAQSILWNLIKAGFDVENKEKPEQLYLEFYKNGKRK